MTKYGKNTVREKKVSRRDLLKGAALSAAAAALPAADAKASVWEAFFQRHFQELNAREMEKVITRIPKARAANRCPPSWTTINRAKPAQRKRTNGNRLKRCLRFDFS